MSHTCVVCVFFSFFSSFSSPPSFPSQELFPANKRSCDYFSKYFTDAGLKELSDFARNQQSIGARKELQKELQEQMSHGEPIREVSMSQQALTPDGGGKVIECVVVDAGCGFMFVFGTVVELMFGC